MDRTEAGRFFGKHYRASGDTLFRLESLPEYATTDDGPNYQLWLDGASEPDPEWKGQWLKILRDEHGRGLRASRVRILSERPTEYERFECDFGYAYNVPAGEDVRVLHRGEHEIPDVLTSPDFWVVNGQHVIVMHYDEVGRFDVAELIEDSGQAAPFLAAHDALMAAAEPFPSWWKRHAAELRRAKRAA